MLTKLISALLIAASISISTVPMPVSAQQQNLPVYIVQSGDTLNLIAIRFGISVNELILANSISDPNQLAAGQQLLIPGLEGVQGTLTTKVVNLGQDLTGLSRKHHISVAQLVKLNRITSPSEIFAGSSLVITVDETRPEYAGQTALLSSQSLLELAIIKNQNPWVLLSANNLSTSSDMIPGETLTYASSAETNNSAMIHPDIQDVQISPLPLVQGSTTLVRVKTTTPLELNGELNGRKLNFFQQETNQYVAIQGVHAMAKPGLADFLLTGKTESGEVFSFEQSIILDSGQFAQDPMLYVDPKTIDPVNTKPEDEQVANITTPAVPTRYWEGKFLSPVDEPICIKSWFGNRRAYNGSEYTYFHTGLDYGVCANLNIYAAAPGKVVFSGPLTVRGNATIIDHGWGIYTAYYHQAEIKVNVGDMVEAGQLIGIIGGTGRVSGPHLHWEVWANGVQVEPFEWLDNTYP